MEQFTKTILTFTLLVILIFGLYFFASWFSVTTGYVLGEDQKIKLAQCLANKNTVFYKSDTCPICDTQEKIFGETAMSFIEVFVCKNPEECPEGGVPAWEISGSLHYGFKNFDELIEISGCEVNNS